MTEEARFQITYTGRAVAKFIAALDLQAHFETELGDLQEAMYSRFLRAKLMAGVLQDTPTETTP